MFHIKTNQKMWKKHHTHTPSYRIKCDSISIHTDIFFATSSFCKFQQKKENNTMQINDLTTVYIQAHIWAAMDKCISGLTFSFRWFVFLRRLLLLCVRLNLFVSLDPLSTNIHLWLSSPPHLREIYVEHAFVLYKSKICCRLHSNSRWESVR